MRSIFKKKTAGGQPGGRPRAAVEIAPEGVLAAALPGPGAAPVYAFAALPAGALAPGIDGPNLRNLEAVTAAIRSALGEVSPRTRAVTLVLPSTVIKVFILDFDSLPGKAAEAIPVLRFRLRKMVSFDVEHAGVSYQVLSQNKTECRVLTAVLPGPVLAEYEAAVRAAGYEPGAVLPSSLAALEMIDSMEVALGANLSALALTTTITNGQDLLLYRTLDLPEDPALRAGDIQRGIAVAAAYYEDRLGAHPRRLHYAGIYPAADFTAWLADPELEVVELVPLTSLDASPHRSGKHKSPGADSDSEAAPALGTANLAGVAGALAGAG
jgi:type IV pilus assembly protein PilM